MMTTQRFNFGFDFFWLSELFSYPIIRKYIHIYYLYYLSLYYHYHYIIIIVIIIIIINAK